MVSTRPLIYKSCSPFTNLGVLLLLLLFKAHQLQLVSPSSSCSKVFFFFFFVLLQSLRTYLSFFFLLILLCCPPGRLNPLYSRFSLFFLFFFFFCWLSLSLVEISCPWYNGYRRRKETRRHEFKFWTKLMSFHKALIPLGNVWILFFSLWLWVNS